MPSKPLSADLHRLVASAVDPAATAGEVKVYSKVALGITQLFARASDGTINQLTPVPTPAPTVTGTGIADAGNAGISPLYSRGDHQHASEPLFSDGVGGFIGPLVTSAPGRGLAAPFQPNVARPVLCIYTAHVASTLGSNAVIRLLSDAANPPVTIRCEAGGGSGALAGDVINHYGTLVYICPPGHFVELVQFDFVAGSVCDILPQTEQAL